MKKELATWLIAISSGGYLYKQAVAALFSWSWILAIPTTIAITLIGAVLFILSTFALLDVWADRALRKTHHG